MSDTGSLFEFVEADDAARWVATPGKQTTFPLSIRNETAEGHEIAVLVEDPTNWAWADPARVSLDPGRSVTVSIVFAPNKETSIAAGVHQAAIRLRDLEGVIFAECIRPFEVEERQELAMTVTLRGPLMSFGMAEGFVLHCTLANRGNIDLTARPVGDPHPTLTFGERAVSVPFGGEVAFDLEVRWNAARRNNHPDVVVLRAPYRGGEARASIEWRYIAEALEPFMPIYSVAEEEDELLSLSWLPQPGADVLEHRLPSIPNDDAAVAPASTAAATPPDAGTGAGEAAPAEPEPKLLQPPAPPPFALRRQPKPKPINPWWPVVQVISGKWRVKPLPILMAIIAVEGFTIGVTQAQRDYYASPDLRRPVPHLSRALQLGSHAAAAIARGAEHAFTATLTAGASLEHRIRFGGKTPSAAASQVPSLWGLSARYLNPNLLSVTYNASDVDSRRLIVASGPSVIYNRKVATSQVLVAVPSGLNAPLRITVSAAAAGGIELRQHLFLQPPAVE